MGRKSRTKRDRRELADFTASLTACDGTWLERPPGAEEMMRLKGAQQVLGLHRAEAEALGKDIDALHRFSLEIFRDARFAPLYFEDWVVEDVIARFGEPPVAEDENDTSFSDYLRQAVLSIATSRVRRAISAQARRFIPAYVEAGQIRQALAIENNAYLTVMSDAVTPLLAQIMVGALSRWYDEHEEEESAEADTSVQT
jgi:hypothetical protein